MLRDADEFKLWIVQRLSEIECKGDPISIAIYTVAILGKAKNDPNIRSSCVSHLEEFLGSNTERFVDDLLQIYSNAEFNSSTEDDPSPRVQSSIEAIDNSSRRSPMNSKGKRSFCPPRRDRSSSTESGSSVDERRTTRPPNINSRGREEVGDRQNFSQGPMPIDSIDSSRQSNYFYRRDRPNFRGGNRHQYMPPQIGIDPSVLQAMKKTFNTSGFSHSQIPVPRRDPAFVGRQHHPGVAFAANSLLITNMPVHINTIGFLNEHYADFGKIENIQVSYGGKSDCALVSFATAEDVQNALQSSNSVFSDGSVSVSLLKFPSPGGKRKRPFSAISFPPRSKLSLNNVARRKTDLVNSKLAQKIVNKSEDKLTKLDEYFTLKTNLLNSYNKQLNSLADMENSGISISDSDRIEMNEMRVHFVQQKEILTEELEIIDTKRMELRQVHIPVVDVSPVKNRILLLSVELSLLSNKCPSRVHLARKRQQILGKLGMADNSFEVTARRLVARVIHTATNERFEVDKRCKTLSIILNIAIDLNQLVDIFKDRLFADSVSIVDGSFINAIYSSHSKADKVRAIINCFTTQPLSVEWADQKVASGKDAETI